jgi:tight adherence protein B
MVALTRHMGAITSTNAPEHLEKLAALSSTWGAPLADLVLAEVRQSRDAAVAHMRKQCAELAERLLIPLGSCALPAFILWGVVPVVFELITTSGIAVFPGAG